MTKSTKMGFTRAAVLLMKREEREFKLQALMSLGGDLCFNSANDEHVRLLSFIEGRYLGAEQKTKKLFFESPDLENIRGSLRGALTFQALTHLCFHNCHKLKKVSLETPLLQTLVISNCGLVDNFSFLSQKIQEISIKDTQFMNFSGSKLNLTLKAPASSTSSSNGDTPRPLPKTKIYLCGRLWETLEEASHREDRRPPLKRAARQINDSILKNVEVAYTFDTLVHFFELPDFDVFADYNLVVEIDRPQDLLNHIRHRFLHNWQDLTFVKMMAGFFQPRSHQLHQESSYGVDQEQANKNKMDNLANEILIYMLQDEHTRQHAPEWAYGLLGKKYKLLKDKYIEVQKLPEQSAKHPISQIEMSILGDKISFCSIKSIREEEVDSPNARELFNDMYESTNLMEKGISLVRMIKANRLLLSYFVDTLVEFNSQVRVDERTKEIHVRFKHEGRLPHFKNILHDERAFQTLYRNFMMGLHHLKYVETFRCCDVKESNIGPRQSIFLRHFMPVFKNLRRVVFRGNMMERAAEYFLKGLKECSTLEELVITENGLTDEHAIYILQHICTKHRITELDLTKNYITPLFLNKLLRLDRDEQGSVIGKELDETHDSAMDLILCRNHITASDIEDAALLYGQLLSTENRYSTWPPLKWGWETRQIEKKNREGQAQKITEKWFHLKAGNKPVFSSAGQSEPTDFKEFIQEKGAASGPTQPVVGEATLPLRSTSPRASSKVSPAPAEERSELSSGSALVGNSPQGSQKNKSYIFESIKFKI